MGLHVLQMGKGMSDFLKYLLYKEMLEKDPGKKDLLLKQSLQLDRIEKQTKPNYLRGIGENVAGNAIYGGLLYILRRILH